MDSKKFDALFSLIESEMKKRERTMLAIDGPAASGKTTLAAFLAGKYEAGVIHMDDFFLPHDRKTAERLAEPDGNIDRERFLAEVVPHLGKNELFSFRRYDCHEGALSDKITIPPSALLIVEGVYCLSDCFIGNYNIKIMLTVSEEEQLYRLRKRCDDERFRNFQSVWLPLEKRYFEFCNIKDKCDMVL